MSDGRLGGIALIAGAVGFIVTMALHPTGHELAEPGQFEHAARLSMVVHSLAIACGPISFLGSLVLARHLDSPGRLAIAGQVVYGFALVAVMAAATVNGFVAPALLGEMLDAEESQRESWHLLLDYNHYLGMTTAGLYTVASSVAIVLWSAAIVATRSLAPALGIYGLVLGPATIVAYLSGHVMLNVHGFGLVVAGQALWFLIAGVLLYRRS